MSNVLILKDFPDRFETARLLLRLPLPGDGAALNEAVIESLEHLRPWLPWAQQAPTLAESEANVRQAYLAFLAREDLRFHLFLKETGELVGATGLHCIRWEVPSFEIGYWVRRSRQGQGLITESTEALTRFAFDTLGARRVEIRLDPTNARSRAIPERLGYELEGVLRADGRTPAGALRDSMVFALVRPDHAAAVPSVEG